MAKEILMEFHTDKAGVLENGSEIAHAPAGTVAESFYVKFCHFKNRFWSYFIFSLNLKMPAMGCIIK